MAATARPEPVGARLNLRLPFGLQRVDDPRLMAPIERSREFLMGGACGSWLGDVHPPDRHRLERLGVMLDPVGQSALASGVSTTSPSTPAVRRPALRSVTRRTLSSVLARDRSINFCRLRTFCRSPVLDAVKIRCRNRRTSSSTRRQSTACQSKNASSGPFTAPTTAVAASNLSSVPGLRSSSSPQAHLTASAPFRARAPGPVSGRLSATATWRRQPSRPGFPLPFGYRHSLLGHPLPAEEFGPPCGRPTGQTPGPRHGFPRSARTSCDRGGCPLYPED